jgi:hypothetical protein
VIKIKYKTTKTQFKHFKNLKPIKTIKMIKMKDLISNLLLFKFKIMIYVKISFTMVLCWTINQKAKVLQYVQSLSIQENIKMARWMARVWLNLLVGPRILDKDIKVLLKMGWNMERVHFILMMALFTKVHISITKKRVLESIFTQMEEFMKVNIKMIK